MTLSRSPGTATTRLMKLVFERSSVGWTHAWSVGVPRSPHEPWSAPEGGWKTTMSPRPGLANLVVTRSTSTRWPTASVGTIDSLGMRNGLTRNAWIPSARAIATTTIEIVSVRGFFAHARVAPDPSAQVVELRAPDVAAGGHLDALDLRGVHGKCALDPHAEGLLAHGERLARARPLALDHDALENLRPPARALDHLEVDPHPVARVERGALAQLLPLEGVDDRAHHGEGAPARIRARRARRDGSAKPRAPRPGTPGSGQGSSAAPRARLRSRRHSRTRAWSPEISTSGTRCPRHSAGRV